MRERLKDKRQRWKLEQGHRTNRHWAERAIWSQPDHVTSTDVDVDVWHTANDRDALPEVLSPALGYTVGYYTTNPDMYFVGGAGWIRLDGNWVRIIEGHEAETKADLPSVHAPALGYTTDDEKKWLCLGKGSWARWAEVPTKETGVAAIITDSSASSPTGYAQTIYVTQSQPENWKHNDLWVEPK